jgi:hypothetical protein
MIERAAKDPNVDIDKMERLFQMHERVVARVAEQAYNAAMSSAQAEIAPVARKLINLHTKSKYADLAAIAEAAQPTISKFGFGLSFSECKPTQPNCMGVACEVTHNGGFSKRYEFNVPLDGAGFKGNANKTDTQAYGSTFTYGRRYATCGVFNIATKNDTDGNAPVATISDEQAEEIKKALDATGGQLPRFCAYYKLEKLTDLPASKFASAMQAIEASAKKRSVQ